MLTEAGAGLCCCVWCRNILKPEIVGYLRAIRPKACTSVKRPDDPEIFQQPIAGLGLAGLPPRGPAAFANAVIARYALEYASKGWNIAVSVDDEFVQSVCSCQHSTSYRRYAQQCAARRVIKRWKPTENCHVGIGYCAVHATEVCTSHLSQDCKICKSLAFRQYSPRF